MSGENIFSDVFALSKPELPIDENPHSFLDLCRTPDVLQALLAKYPAEQILDEITKNIKKTSLGLRDLMQSNLRRNPRKNLFIDLNEPQRPFFFTYEDVFRDIEKTAAFFHKNEPIPRVALFIDNCPEGAIVDLACLMFDIFVTPLNTNFNTEQIAYIFRQTDINFAVSDRPERLETVGEAARKSGKAVRTIFIGKNKEKECKGDFCYEDILKQTNQTEIQEILEQRPRFQLNDTATVMYTSGSTGQPKGVAFSMYNIVVKRFARALAVPFVGKNEIMLSYLPLFHTFGRYLELTGTVYWNGTYVFVSRLSANNLIDLFPKINPSLFISIPLRWVQLYEKCNVAVQKVHSETDKMQTVRGIVGSGLKWGLSAAGFLDPKIFRFFRKYGIELCSGFGMTEATGGITMTPPGVYRDGTVGTALPGIKTRLNEHGELEISGHYVGRYFEDNSKTKNIPFPENDDYWFSTGDVFTIDTEGYHTITDRVKDIYKNSKGQTVSPAGIESKFAGVPGIKRVFLAGDGKPYNVLLIVPDLGDSIFETLDTQSKQDDYFRSIIASANKDLPYFERMINYTVLKTDFSVEKDELTAKGSFKRKNIVANNAEIIDSLYRDDKAVFRFNEFEIVIPPRFFSESSVLQSELVMYSGGILNRRNGKILRLKKTQTENMLQIGDFEYRSSKNSFDLSILTNYPLFWAGNPNLCDFAKCRINFETIPKTISKNIQLSENQHLLDVEYLERLPKTEDKHFNELVFTLNLIFYTETDSALSAIADLEKIAAHCEEYLRPIIINRLQTLAFHRDEEVRTEAYRILLNMTEEQDDEEYYASFIVSGKRFLTENSIKKITQSQIGFRHLDSLRKRLKKYRSSQLDFSSETIQNMFSSVFDLLFEFGLRHPENYSAVRAELASWSVFDKSPEIARQAENLFYRLFDELETGFEKRLHPARLEVLIEKIIFDENVSEHDRSLLLSRLSNSNFIAFSLMLIYGETISDLSLCPSASIVVSKLESLRDPVHYRMSINTKNGKHFDLHIVIDNDIDGEYRQKIMRLYIALDGLPAAASPLPRFGSCDLRHKIVSYRYVDNLTAADYIRHSAGKLAQSRKAAIDNDFRKLYIRAGAVFFRTWHLLERKILPGTVSPANVAIPANDFNDQSVIISLTGARECSSAAEFFILLYKNFYRIPLAHNPSLKSVLKINRIFHACVEALGEQEAVEIFNSALSELMCIQENEPWLKELTLEMEKYSEGLKKYRYLPVNLFAAIERFAENDLHGESENREKNAEDVFELYRLSEHNDYIKLYYFRHTYFSHFDSNFLELFDALLEKSALKSNQPALLFTELSDLLGMLEKQVQRDLLLRVVFPELKKQKIALTLREKRTGTKLAVQTEIIDKSGACFTISDADDVADIGASYKMFFKEHFIIPVKADDRFLIAKDSDENRVASLCWHIDDSDTAYLDGLVVSSPYQNRGIASAMIDDFRLRMSALKVIKIKHHFLLKRFFSVEKLKEKEA